MDYDERSFYTESVDKLGHRATVRVNIPPGVANEIAALVARQVLPYRTSSDVVRDALVHRLHYITNELGIDEMPQTTLWTVQMQVEAEKVRRETQDKIIKDLDSELAISHSDPDRLAKLLVIANNSLSLLDDSHREQLQRLISRY